MSATGRRGLLFSAVLAGLAILASVVVARLGVDGGTARLLGVVVGIAGTTVLLVRGDGS